MRLVAAAILAAAIPVAGQEPAALTETPAVTYPLLSAGLAERAAPGEAFSGPVPLERIADPFARDMLWLGLGLSADLLSTSWALRECPTCYEANPLGHDSEARIALKLGMASAVGVTQYRLRRGGHHGWATGIRWAAAILHAGLTINNGRHALSGGK